MPSSISSLPNTTGKRVLKWGYPVVIWGLTAAILTLPHCTEKAKQSAKVEAVSLPPLSHSLDKKMPRQRRAQKARQSASHANPCLKLVERACDFLGTHSEECSETRARVPQAPRQDVRKECQDILDFFELTFAEDTDRNPCYVLARRVCNDVGRRTQVCKDRRAAAKRYAKRSHRKACKGDLLLWEARNILTP